MQWTPAAAATATPPFVDGDLPVLVVDEGAVRRIVLNRPQVNNAINQPVCDLIDAALAEYEARDDLRVAILCANGRNFCAGMDLRDFLTTGIPSTVAGGFAGLVELPRHKPLIAAVQGAALAGGLEIALACDLIVASRSARFGLPEVTKGLVAAAGGLIRLPRVIPYGVAMRAALTGDPIDAETALGLGLVGELAADDDGLPVVVGALAARIAANAPLAVAASRQVVQDSYGLDVAESFRRQHTLSDPVFASDDAREGAASFAERREPVWAGR